MDSKINKIALSTELNFSLYAADPSSPEASILSNELHAELEELYGKGNIEEFDEENRSFLYFVLIKGEKNIPAGCGALKYFDPFAIEIKRMYVRKEFRGKGLSKQILSELERKAKEMKYLKVVLETGLRQPEALNLYKNSGYVNMKKYGIHADDPETLCMQKKLN